MKRKWAIAIGLLVVFAACLAAAALVYFSQRAAGFNTRPVVLVVNPLNRSHVMVGRGLVVQASAASAEGIARVELWIDGQFVASEAAPEKTAPARLRLSSGWTPQVSGRHVIVVRAFAENGVEGQGTVAVQAEIPTGGAEAAAGETLAYVVQPGETLESIAAANEITPQEIADLNPQIGEEGVQAGDALALPAAETEEDQPASAASDPASPGGETAPAPGDEAPGSPSETGAALDLFFQAEAFNPLRSLLFSAVPNTPDPQPALLRLEALRLETRARYEAVHCYVSLARNDPQWIPDPDQNQATDETFLSSDGGHTWDIATYYSGKASPILSWREGRALPFIIECVAVTRGGADSLDLGRIKAAAPAQSWGAVQRVASSGGEDKFLLDYRVSPLPTGPAAEEKGLDENMTAPTNARVDLEDAVLRWDYTPAEGEAAISGFAILLNETLQWVDAPNARLTHLPAQWLNPPCGDEYVFTVVAARGEYPAGDYSPPSNPAIVSRREGSAAGCTRTVVVTFDRLTTGDLGSDGTGRFDVGDMGPVYGTFFAGDQQIGFDGHALEGDNFPSAFGLDHRSDYSVSQISGDYGDGPARFVVELPDGDPNVNNLSLWIGFDIWDDDTGHNNHDDRVCNGEIAFYDDDLARRLTGEIETDLPVDALPDRCRVSYTIDPVGETPVVEPGSPPPLPDLVVQDLSVEPTHGQLRIHVVNAGQAAWQNRDLLVRVTWPSGDEFGSFTWRDLTINPSQEVFLQSGAMNPHPALGVCVTLDPNNSVEEAVDRAVENGMLAGPATYCRPRPDLTIADAQYDQAHDQLKITVENDGQSTHVPGLAEGSLENADLTLQMVLSSGAVLTRTWPGINLGLRGTTVLAWPVERDVRVRMVEGYTLVLDPADDVAEADETNNERAVPAQAMLKLQWSGGWAHYCATDHLDHHALRNTPGKNTWDMRLSAIVSGGGTNRTVASWTSPEFEADGFYYGEGWCKTNPPFVSDWFTVAGDEVLYVDHIADLTITGHGYRWFSGGVDALTIFDDFGGTTRVPRNAGEGYFENPLPYTWQAGQGLQQGVCGASSYFSLDENTGIHASGIIQADSPDIYYDCWWSTSYALYRDETQ